MRLPKDKLGEPYSVLRHAISQNLIAVTGSANRSDAFANKTQVIDVIADQPIFFQTGNVTVTATNIATGGGTSHYLPTNVIKEMSLGLDFGGSVAADLHTHISVIAATTTSANVYVSEKD